MTHIVSYPTKKAFREAVAAGPVWADDPSIFNPRSGYVHELVATGYRFTVTNHPKRSWFAAVEAGKDGKPRVT